MKERGVLSNPCPGNSSVHFRMAFAVRFEGAIFESHFEYMKTDSHPIRSSIFSYLQSVLCTSIIHEMRSKAVGSIGISKNHFLNLNTCEPATKMEVVEQGTHETLVGRQGRYWEIMLAQSLDREGK
jgi:hypothetical protein